MAQLIATVRDYHTISKAIELGMTGCILSCDFFATRQMGYFTKEEIAKAIVEYPELAIYTNINRIFVEDELLKLKEFLLWCSQHNLAGIYYSDPAVYMLAKELHIEDRLIYNQDTILTNHYDIQEYLQLGIQRCVISREITLEEIIAIIQNCGSHLELMIHGHTNLSYSKRRLLTNYFEEIKKDYPVDQIYLLEEESRNERMYIMQDEQGTHIFTGKCLQMVKELPLFMNQIDAVRIDGVFMSDEEVLDAIRFYASIINGQSTDEVYEAWIEPRKDQYHSGYLYTKTNISK